jgi:hypothetical protein
MTTNTQGTSVEELRHELEGIESPDDTDGTGEGRSEAIVAEATAGLTPGRASPSSSSSSRSQSTSYSSCSSRFVTAGPTARV